MAGWRWAAASCTGSSHIRTGTRRQDAFSCFAKNGVLFAVASDGAGSASFGGAGARLICRTFATHGRSILASGDLPSDADLWECVDEARDRIGVAASIRELERRHFAATLICLVSTGDRTLVAHIGDGCAVVRAADATWAAASWPEQGEYASTTFFVTDEPAPRLRITRLETAITAAAVFTDGIERIALDFAANQPHAPFFNSMIGPVDGEGEAGRDPLLSLGLARFLDSPAVLERTDDDKTLILVSASAR